MLRRLFLLSLFVFAVGKVSFGNSVYTKEQMDRFSKVRYAPTKVGDALGSVRINEGTPINYKPSFQRPNPTGVDFWDGKTEVVMSTLRNYYDLQSNGVPLEIWQDPTNPNNIHACFTFSAEETGWNDRTVQYFFSDDRGATWNLIGNVPVVGRSGFGTITGLSSGAALIACHTAIGSNTATRTIVFADAFPGLGSFNSLDPNDGVASKYIWPRIVATSNVNDANKFVYVASTNPEDSAFYNVGTSLTTGSFLGYKFVNAGSAEVYSLARGADGRIGIAYVANPTLDPANDGTAWYIESTNGGTSFGTPVKIYQSANVPGDSLQAFQGIGLVFKGNTPCVVFDAIHLGNLNIPSKIRFWSNTLPGADPTRSVVIADSGNVPYHPIQGSVSDNEGPICRPSIGVSSDGNNLYVSMIAQSDQTGGLDTASYNDVYVSASGNGGLSWKRPRKVNESGSPRFDWNYCSVSPSNDVTGNTYSINMTVQRDPIPAANVNSGNPDTDAKPVFWRLTGTGTIGVGELSAVAQDYSLSQNFPNPFNPTTSIRFSLPQLSNVTLKVYNVNGQEVATLVNNELIAAGVKEVSFNAASLASGLYFYTITAGNFKETKKMMLIK